MNKNVGSFDSILRVIIGILILLIGFFTQSWWGLLGLIPLLTGIVKFCPGYFPFKISTNKSEKS